MAINVIHAPDAGVVGQAAYSIGSGEAAREAAARNAQLQAAQAQADARVREAQIQAAADLQAKEMAAQEQANRDQMAREHDLAMLDAQYQGREMLAENEYKRDRQAFTEGQKKQIGEAQDMIKTIMNDPFMTPEEKSVALRRASEKNPFISGDADTWQAQLSRMTGQQEITPQEKMKQEYLDSTIPVTIDGVEVRQYPDGTLPEAEKERLRAATYQKQLEAQQRIADSKSEAKAREQEQERVVQQAEAAKDRQINNIDGRIKTAKFEYERQKAQLEREIAEQQLRLADAQRRGEEKYIETGETDGYLTAVAGDAQTSIDALQREISKIEEGYYQAVSDLQMAKVEAENAPLTAYTEQEQPVMQEPSAGQPDMVQDGSQTQVELTGEDAKAIPQLAEIAGVSVEEMAIVAKLAKEGNEEAKKILSQLNM